MNDYLEMAKEIEELIVEGEDFNEALDKVSKKYNLNQDGIDELVETYEDNYISIDAEDDFYDSLPDEEEDFDDDFFEEDE